MTTSKEDNLATDAHVDRLIDIANSIEPHKFTILTGSNASGKSVIRKILPVRIAPKLGIDKESDMEHCVASISLLTRVSSSPFGGPNLAYETNWMATSVNSLDLVQNILETTNRYIVLDEPEIGMGEELQLAVARYLNSVKDTVLANGHGLLIITHSRIIVKELDNDVFINIDGYPDKQSWLDREIVPTDFDAFENRAQVLFQAIAARSKN